MDLVQVIRCRDWRKRRQSSKPCLQYLANMRVTSVTNQGARLVTTKRVINLPTGEFLMGGDVNPTLPITPTLTQPTQYCMSKL